MTVKLQVVSYQELLNKYFNEWETSNLLQGIDAF